MGKSSSWEVNSHSASHEIPCLLCNLKVHNCIHMAPTLIPILSHMHPVHTLPTYFYMIHSNIIFPSMPRNSKWSLPFMLSNKNIVSISHLSHLCYMPHPLTSLPKQYFVKSSIYVAHYAVFSSFLPLRSKYSHHPVLKHSQSMRDQISHLYKTGKIMVLKINL
jgi:hypothetical protein